MIELNRESIEAKVIKTLQKEYPITFEELRRKLKLRNYQLSDILKKLGNKGLVGQDILPDKTYVRIISEDVCFVGRKATQRRGIVRKTDRKKAKPYEGQMYL